ncbi:MAG: DNA polymerase III subunit gamma/tau [Casimicrobiaceae bacterium]
MSYQVLARKWRPRNFAELAGQEHVVQALTNALTRNRLHHAYLLTGTRGVGKTTIARILAKSLNCETGVTATPCGVCAACVAIDEGRFVDLIELDAASNTGIDNMREILDNARYAPTVGRYKVYLIDEVHMLSKAAFNSMLKTLEEPPEHVKFVLATTDPQKIPITVLSRCLQFNLKQLPPAVVAKQLEHVLGEEKIEFEPGAIRVLSRAAQGSMRDALSLLDQAIAYGAGGVQESVVRQMIGAVDSEIVVSLLEAIADNDVDRVFAEAKAMSERNLSFDAALQDIAVALHDIALLKVAPAAVASDLPARERLLDLAARMDAESVQLNYQIAVQGRGDLPLAPDEFAGFTMTLLRMLAFAPAESGREATLASAGPETPVARPARAATTAVAPTPVTERSEPAAPSPIVSVTASSEPPPSPIVSAAADAALDDWPQWVAQCKLNGMAQQLAYNAELKAHRRTPTGIELDLTLGEPNRHLADRSYQDKLSEALRAALGVPVRLKIEIGGAGETSMAVQERRARQALQEKATASFNDEPFVKEAVKLFDARVRPQTIQPNPTQQGTKS